MMLLIAFLSIIPFAALKSDVICPDSSKCPANTTCCAWSKTVGYGCCPLIGAVCCQKDFCCEQGQICENHFKTCITLVSSKNSISFSQGSNSKMENVPCPGAGGSCPDGDTCCQTGCCPLPNAVCCTDGEHCCPANTTCDVSVGLCIGSKGELYRATTVPRNKGYVSLKPEPRDVPCPGAGGSCPDGDTCCQAGCCPLPNAVCCSDGEHCCPANTTCDVTAGLCIGSKGELHRATPKYKVARTEVLKSAERVNAGVVYCPGGQVYCPDYNTCCILPNGQWGCCPYPSAVCCADRVHCCPAGTHCSSTSTTCLNSKSEEVSAGEKFLARLLGNH